jgi:hypothetical protein
MTLPNDANVGLHRAMGFEPVGTYRRIGWNHGSWDDVAWVQRTLATAQDPPAEPGDVPMVPGWPHVDRIITVWVTISAGRWQ